MKTTPDVKIFKTRDSATSCLRKLGFQSSEYDLFLKKLSDGQISCEMAKAQAHLASSKQTKPVAAKQAKPVAAKQAKPVAAKQAKPVAAKQAKVKRVKEPRRAQDALITQSTPIHKLVKKSGGKSIAETARNMILGGASNEEVWVALKKQFHLDDGKKHYPTWYRCELNRKGLMPGQANNRRG